MSKREQMEDAAEAFRSYLRHDRNSQESLLEASREYGIDSEKLKFFLEKNGKSIEQYEEIIKNQKNINSTIISDNDYLCQIKNGEIVFHSFSPEEIKASYVGKTRKSLSDKMYTEIFFTHIFDVQRKNGDN